jgi:hypothetical protein
MAQPDISGLKDLGDGERLVRRIRPEDMTENAATREPEIIPTSLRFDPDLSTHRISIIEAVGTTVEAEYGMPPNGAIEIPVDALRLAGYAVKETPTDVDPNPVLGAAHASVFGKERPKPSNTEKAEMRDIILEPVVEWLARPEGRPAKIEG